MAASLILPSALRPFNLLWFKFGLLMQKVVNPLIMALMFFVVITPIGLLMRALGRDLLLQKFDATAKTYWIRRDKNAGTMKNQF
jgi:large-conductance mechanosensitive channel